MLWGRHHEASIDNVFLIFDAFTLYISVIVFFIYNIAKSKEQSSHSLNKLGPCLKTALYADIHKLCSYCDKKWNPGLPLIFQHQLLQHLYDK